jgi:hypothetical protein
LAVGAKQKMPERDPRPAFSGASKQTKTELCAIRRIFFGLDVFRCRGLNGMS